MLKPLACGGIFSAMLLTLLVILAVYVIRRWHADVRLRAEMKT